MNKICTTLKQSEELIALGLDKMTADMAWDLLDGDEPDNKVPFCQPDRFDVNDDEFVPAWSLSALLELIPAYLGEFNDGIDFGLSKSMNNKWYSAHYLQIKDNETTATKVITGDTSVDAAFEMVKWLIKNSKI